MIVTSTTGAVRPSWKFQLKPIWLAIPGVLFLTLFFLWPTCQILVSALHTSRGDFNLSAITSVFTSPLFSRVLLNTFGAAGEVVVLCLLVSYPLTIWLSNQTPRRQRFLMMLILLPYWTSALVKNFAWLVILGRNGMFGRFLSSIGLAGDSLLFNRYVVLFGIVHTLTPLAVIAMMPAINQVNKSLLRAASTLGATPESAFWRVFVPLSMRGVATSGLMIFITTLGFFITPALLGSPRETMIGQNIIDQINELQNLQQGAALGLVLLIGALIAVFLFDRIFGFSGIAGGQGKANANGLARRFGLWLAGTLGDIAEWTSARTGRNVARSERSWILATYSFAVIALLLVPIFAIVPMAFTSGNFLAFPPPGLSIRWFEAYMESPVWMAATARSFGIGFVTALVTVVVATSVAFAIVRSKSRLAGAVFMLFMSPMIVPHLVVAIGLFYLFAQVSLIATNTGLVIGHSVIAMPIVFIIILSTLRGHDWRLDDAALTLGATPRVALFRITLPLIKGGILAGLITGFLVSFEELTVALFIGGGLIVTLPKQLWGDIFLQVSPTLAAASVAVLAVVVIMFAVLEVSSSLIRRSSSVPGK